MKTPYIIDKEKCESRDGNNASVYLFDDLAIKVPKIRPKNPMIDIKSEYLIHKKIYANGYPVPMPFGVYPATISNPSWGERTTDALFMERIFGRDLDSIVLDDGFKEGLSLRDVHSVYLGALDIANKIKNNLGLCPRPYYDILYRNIMYDPEREKLFLIDFGDWEDKRRIATSWSKKFFCGVHKDFREYLFLD